MRQFYSLLFIFFPPVALDKARFKVGGYCEVCKTAVTYIDRILEKNSTESQIEEAVRKVCSFLPDSMRTEVRAGGGNFCLSSVTVLDLNPTFLCHQCDQLVEQYEPVIVQLLLQMLDPDFVCMVNHSSCLLSVNPDFVLLKPVFSYFVNNL